MTHTSFFEQDTSCQNHRSDKQIQCCFDADKRLLLDYCCWFDKQISACGDEKSFASLCCPVSAGLVSELRGYEMFFKTLFNPKSLQQIY